MLSERLPFSKKKKERKRKVKTYCISIRLVLRSSFSLLISIFSVRLPTSSNCLKCGQDTESTNYWKLRWTSSTVYLGEVSGGCGEITLARYREVYGCIMTPSKGARRVEHLYFSKSLYDLYIMQWNVWLIKQKPKVHNKVLNKIKRDRYKECIKII